MSAFAHKRLHDLEFKNATQTVLYVYIHPNEMLRMFRGGRWFCII